MSSPEKLLQVLRATLRMMGGRGYNVEGYAPLETINVAGFINFFGQRQNTYVNDPLRKAIIDEKYFSMRSMMSCILYRGTESCLLLFMNSPKSVPIDMVEFFVKIFIASQVTRGILITPNELTGPSTNYYTKMKRYNLIQHFTDIDIEIDPTVHIYNSDVRILSVQEKKEVLGDLDPRRIPQTFEDEPLVKYIGAVNDDLVEYNRETFLPTMLVEEDLFYRYTRKALK